LQTFRKRAFTPNHGELLVFPSSLGTYYVSVKLNGICCEIMFAWFRYWLAHGAEPKKSVAVLLGLVRNVSSLCTILNENNKFPVIFVDMFPCFGKCFRLEFFRFIRTVLRWPGGTERTL
jgi:hypothetical protein